MKKFLIFFVILFSLYSILWFVGSNVLEKKIHTKIEELQSDGTINSYSGNIEVTGYPFRMAVSLDYPNISFTPKEHTGEYNFLYDGSIDIIVGVFSNSIKLKTSGDLHLKGHINNYPFHLVSSGGNNQYKVKLHDFLLSPSLINKFLNNKKNFTDIFFDTVKEINVDIRGINTINKLNNGLVFSSDKANMNIRTSHSTKYNIGYKESASNSTFGRESIILWNHFETIPTIRRIMKDVPYNVKSYFSAFELNNLGTINYDADIYVKIGDSGYANIDINSFLLEDDIEKINISGKILLDGYRKEIDLDAKMEFTERWYDLMKIYSKLFNPKSVNFSLFPDTKNSIVSVIFSPISGFFNGVFGKNSSGMRQNYVPRLHEFGKIESKINLIKKPGIQKEFSINLETFKLSTNQYSISASGDLSNHNQKDEYRFEADLVSYPKLVDVATNYVNRLSSSSGYDFILLGSTLHISDNTSNTIKSMIQKVSEEPSLSRVDAKIKARKTAENKYPEVGRYSSEQFGVMWQEFISQLVFEKVTGLVQGIKKTLKKESDASDSTSSPQELLGSIFKNIIRK